MMPATYQEPARYVAIGAGCALLNNAILILGDHGGLHYAVSLLITFIVVLPASYVAHARWTFRSPVSPIAFARFMTGSIASLIVASVAVGVCRGLLALPMVVAAPLATVAMIFYNYAMARWAIKRRPSRSARLEPETNHIAEAS